MTRKELLVQLAEILGTTVDQLTDEAGPTQISGWDSIAALNVISLMDDAGKGEVTTEDAAKFSTIGGILSFAKTRGIINE